MWLYLIIVLVILAIVGGTLGGGVFTIVLIPLAAVVVISAVVYGVLARATDEGRGGTGDPDKRHDKPLPRHRRRPSGRVPTSPEGLTDARRQQQ